jgi:CheY-like chemotaxis protein
MNPIAREPAEILLIDCDPLARDAAARALEEAGHVVYAAGDRANAIKIARGHGLDLIVCDVNLRGASGLELCRELRRLPGMEDVPLMFVSRSQLPDIVRRSHEAGGAYYLRKPLDPDVLCDLVSKALWLPHLVQTRITRPEGAAAGVPARKASAARAAAVQGIRLPLA